MPPKKLSSLKSISISGTGSRGRPHMINDLITKSQAALSSQATILTHNTQNTQNTRATQQTNLNQGMGQNQYAQFNREELSQVFITKQEEQVIQKILQIARKGKVNSKNAFQIPLKVIHSESNSSINNKFWKFASQLLGASMNIYDKRIQNMDASTNAFQSKLSRIGFDIRDKKLDQQNQERLDDVNAADQQRRNRNHSQRQQLLNINFSDFEGCLNLEDKNIIGYSTLERKQKIEVKNIEYEFIADPTFLKTQKMFDSYSLKSLLLNIFEISPNLDVRIFHQSNLQIQNFQKPTNSNPTKNEIAMKAQNFGQIQNDDSKSSEYSYNKQEMQEKQQFNSKNISNLCFDNSALPYQFEKHIQITKNLIKQRQLLHDINKFIKQQPELKKDYYVRNPGSNLQRQLNQNQNQNWNQNQGRNQDEISYGEIIEQQRLQFIQIFKEINETFDQDMGGHHFSQLQNGQGLYETHETQSQQFSFDNGQSFLSLHPNSLAEHFQTNSVPISLQQSFFSWDQKANIIEPIMPWQIEFKNLKLTKKRRNIPKKSHTSKENKKVQAAKIDFSLQILDIKQVLAQKDSKTLFQKTMKIKSKFQQRNLLQKQNDYVHSQYHKKFRSNFKFEQILSQKLNIKEQIYSGQKQNNKNVGNFIFDIDQNINYCNLKKQQDAQNQFQQQTHFEGPNNDHMIKNQFSGDIFSEGQLHLTKDTSFFGSMVGVNNIREIKKMVNREIIEKGWTSIQYLSKVLVNLSPAQIFTILLHLTNQNQYIIRHQFEGDQSNIILQIPKNSNKRNKIQQINEQEDIQI